MPTYKLCYFDGRGRAELARYLFALAGVKYEDKRFNKDTWPDFKPKTPTGQLPVLDVDGKLYCQSIPIAIFLARQFGYYGRTDEDSFAILEVLGVSTELLSFLVSAFLEKDETKKAALFKTFKEEHFPKYVGYFEKLLSQSGTGYFTGHSLTLADLVVFDVLSRPMSKDPSALDKYPKVKENYLMIAETPKIKAWVDKRPKTEF